MINLKIMYMIQYSDKHNDNEEEDLKVLEEILLLNGIVLFWNLHESM